jgi:transcriptional regulator with XRE-family HTH domain
MSRLKNTLAKLADTEEQALRNLLSANIKKYRHRRNWSQFTLAAKIDISTNFLADIEAGNTWVSSQTLVKLAKAFEIEVYELLKPEKAGNSGDNQGEDDQMNALIDRFSRDLTVVLKDSVEKSIEHTKKQYKND